MSLPDLDLVDLIKPQLRMMQRCGVVPYNQNYGKRSYVAIALFVVLPLSEIANFILNRPSIEDFADATFVMLTHIVQSCKLFFLVLYKNRLIVLIKKINQPSFMPRTQYQCDKMNSYIKLNKYVARLGHVAVFGCIVTILLRPLAEEIVTLPIPAWFGINHDEFPNFQIVYIFQSVAFGVSGMWNAAWDLLVSGFITVVVAQLALLNDSLINIKEISVKELKFPLKPYEEMTEELQKIMYKNLRACVIHHQNILSFVDEISFLFSTTIFAQFVVSVLIICLTLYKMTTTPVLSEEFVALNFYMFCMLMEIFIWCYFGNEATFQSSKLTTFAYCGDWLNCNEKFKKTLIIFMTRSGIYIKFYAGGLITLSLETFISIIKSSYSYLTVLQQFTDEI